MARRAWCPDCEQVVELPHKEVCPRPSYAPENEGGPAPVKYTGPRDDEGRPIGRGVKAGKNVGSGELIDPKFVDPGK